MVQSPRASQNEAPELAAFAKEMSKKEMKMQSMDASKNTKNKKSR
jgi:hypothetical protein